MKSGFDINLISGDGYLVIPLSMARLAAGQSPEDTYSVFHYFTKKLATFSNDVVLLYTSGLYLNAEHLTHLSRLKLNEQMITHALAVRKLIQKRKQYIPPAFHFLPIEYVILNAKDFRLFFNTLKKVECEDPGFRKSIRADMNGRPYTEPNTNFILEEVAVAHIIRQRLVEFPRTLVRNDIWRLIAYPGPPMAADKYQWQHKLLPQPDKINPYGAAQYDFEKKRLYVFDEK